MSEGDGTAKSAIWAITMIIIVAMLAGAIYYSGILTKKAAPSTDVDINVEVPATTK